MSKRLALVLVLVWGAAVNSSAIGFWRQLPPAPVGGAPGQAALASGDTFYVLWNDGLETQPQLWAYDAGERRWTPLNTNELAPGTFRPGTALADPGDGWLYALAGANADDEDRRAFFRFEVRRQRWERLADTPHAQGSGNALVWDPFAERVYALLGGPAAGEAFASYDPRVDRWEQKNFPESWTCVGPGAALASLGRFGVYALRGACGPRTGEGAFAYYDPFRLRWSDLPGVPEPVGPGGSLLWIGAFESNQSTFVYALAGGSGEAPGRGVYRYDLDNGRWQALAGHLCPTGVYAGNRLGYLDEAIHYWQGAPADETFICGGGAFLQLLGIGAQ